MNTYVIGAIAGLVFGGIVGSAKYFLVWKSLLKTDKKITVEILNSRFRTGFAINITAILVLFLARSIMPFDVMTMIIATAVALILLDRLTPVNRIVEQLRKKMQEEEEDEE